MHNFAKYATPNLFDVPLADENHHIHPYTENDYTTNDILQQIEKEENERRVSDGDDSLHVDDIFDEYDDYNELV